jgi:hypothetical protein
VTTTTHVAASCLITICAVRSGQGPATQALAASTAALLAHLALDMLPHGFVATPQTIFKKIGPTLAELLPPIIILGTAVVLFGQAHLFLTTAFFGLLPDIVSTLYYKRREFVSASLLLLTIHRLHRKAHWFEAEGADGRVVRRFPNAPLLSIEALLASSLFLALLWIQ